MLCIQVTLKATPRAFRRPYLAAGSESPLLSDIRVLPGPRSLLRDPVPGIAIRNGAFPAPRGPAWKERLVQ
jgi:hypothetical protein